MKGTSFFKIRKMVALQALQAARMAMTGAGAVFCLYSAAAGAPSISPVYPKDTVVWEASPACLVVRVTAGTGPFTYSWYKGSTPDLAVLLDTTNTPCRGPITKDSLSDTLMFSGYLFESGYYVCVVRNLPSDSVISRIAHFIVQKLGPVIIVQPKDTSVLEDDPVSFTIVATGYTPSFNYKWNYWDSNSISFSYTIFFGPVNTFTFPNENHPLGAQLSDSGYYFCQIVSPYGYAWAGDTSGAGNCQPCVKGAKLTVIRVVPKIDTSTPGDVEVWQGRPAGLTVSATNRRGTPRSYAWYKDTVVNSANLISGQTDSTLYIPVAQLPDSGQYLCVVSDKYGADTSRAAHLTVLESRPVIVPKAGEDKTVPQGSPFSFTVTATGDRPSFTYTWYKNSIAVNSILADQTSRVLSYPSASLSDSGYYICVVSNVYGTDTGQTDHLTVTGGMQISNPIVLRGSFIDSTHVNLTISHFMDLPYAAPFPYADKIFVWYKADTWPVENDPDSVAFLLSDLRARQTNGHFNTVLTMRRYSTADCYSYNFLGSVHWKKTTASDSLPPFDGTLNSGVSIYMCDTTPLVNPLALSFLNEMADSSVIVTVSNLRQIFDWTPIDSLNALHIGYSVAGGARKDTVFPISSFSPIPFVFVLTFKDSRFAGEQKVVDWQVWLNGTYFRISPVVRASDTVGLPPPENRIQLIVGSVTQTQIGLYWPVLPDSIMVDAVTVPYNSAIDSIRIWYGQKQVPLGRWDIPSDSFSSITIGNRTTSPSSPVTVTGLIDDQMYYFGAQVKSQGLWSVVTANSSTSQKTLPSIEQAIANTLFIDSISFDAAANKAKFFWHVDTTDLLLTAGVVWRTDSAAADTTHPTPSQTVSIPGAVSMGGLEMEYDLDITPPKIEFDTTYYFGIWLRTTNGKWPLRLDGSKIRRFRIPLPSQQSVVYFTTSDTVYGLGRNVVLRKVKGNLLSVQSTLHLMQPPALPVASSRCVAVSIGFYFEQHAALPLPLYVGLRYDPSLIPAGYTANDIRMYHYDAVNSRWFANTATQRPDTAGHVVSVYDTASNCIYPFILMVDTVHPRLTVVSPADIGVPVQEARAYTMRVQVSDNMANVRATLLVGRASDSMDLLLSVVDPAVINATNWVVTSYYPIKDVGVRALFVLYDGHFSDTVDVSRNVIRPQSDPVAIGFEKWTPLGATAVLDSPGVVQALDEFKGDDGTWKYDDTKVRLYRYMQNGWREYSTADSANFRFEPGRVLWLKTRISLAGPLDLGRGHTVPVNAPDTIVLPAAGWTDICLPFRFNIRVGDILLKTNLPVAEKNGLAFYKWRVNTGDAKQRYFTNGVYLPPTPGLNDSTYELTVGQENAYSVYNSLNHPVTLKIPPTPVVYSQVLGKRQIVEKGWSVAVVPYASDGALSPVYCGYVEGCGGIKSCPMPPSWSMVSVGIYDRSRRQEYGSLIRSEAEDGGCSFELVFGNEQEAKEEVRYTVERMTGLSGSMKVAVINPGTGMAEAADGRGQLTVTVAGHSREYRWLAVGSQGYIDGMGRKFTQLEFGLSRCMPNPFRGMLRIRYTIPYSGISSVRCEVVDQRGRLLWSAKSGRELHPGRNEMQWNPASGRTRLAAGAYIVCLTGFDGKGKVIGQKQSRIIYLP